jgi:Uma2 family endonuclease
METLELDLTKRYTFADYLTWIDNRRRELINGFVKMMTPALSTKHQQILGELHGQLWQQLKKKKCKVFPAPFDIRFPSKSGEIEDDAIFTVVQPEISIICDHKKIDDKGCVGAPDLIMEILSLASTKRDVEEKYILYQENGVKEYWIIHPNDQTATVFFLENGKYKLHGIFAKESVVQSPVFEGNVIIDLNEVFEE